MNLVIIETPYFGEIERNIEYAKRCMLDSINRGECPFASHLLYTQVLDDNNGKERQQGMELGFEIMSRADLVVVYTDYGISEGMRLGIRQALKLGLEVKYRTIGTIGTIG